MASVLLSKNTLKRFHDFTEGNCNSEIIARPKTAVAGKRTPSAANRRDTPNPNNSQQSYDYDIYRPKTSYGRQNTNIVQKEQLSHDRGNNTNREPLSIEGVRKSKKTESEKTSSLRKWRTIDIENALEDIDIVEYFNDKSFRDIFPIYTDDESEVNKDERIHRVYHNMPFKPQTQLKQNLGNTQDIRLQKRMVLNRLNQRTLKSKELQLSPDINPKITDGDSNCTTSPIPYHKTRHNVSIAPVSRNSKRQQSDHSFYDKSSLERKPHIPNNQKPVINNGEYIMRGKLTIDNKVSSYFPQRNNNISQLVKYNRYMRDMRYIDQNKRMQVGPFRNNDQSRPLTLHMNKYPKKLEPILSTNKKVRCKSEIPSPTKK